MFQNEHDQTVKITLSTMFVGIFDVHTKYRPIPYFKGQGLSYKVGLGIQIFWSQKIL